MRILSLLVSKYAIAFVTGGLSFSFLMLHMPDYAQMIVILSEYIVMTFNAILGLKN